MTKSIRGAGAPMQLKDSRETLASVGVSMTTKTSAQLVVCAYVDAWHADDSEEEKISVTRELLDILGLLGR